MLQNYYFHHRFLKIFVRSNLILVLKEMNVKIFQTKHFKISPSSLSSPIKFSI